jgi:hypothetical protein
MPKDRDWLQKREEPEPDYAGFQPRQKRSWFGAELAQ